MKCEKCIHYSFGDGCKIKNVISAINPDSCAHFEIKESAPIGNKRAVCPKCGSEYAIGMESFPEDPLDGDTADIICENCGLEYRAMMEIDITFSSEKIIRKEK